MWWVWTNVLLWSREVSLTCGFLQVVWSLAPMLPRLTEASKSCWTLRIRWADRDDGCRSVSGEVNLWTPIQVFSQIRNEHFSNVFGYLSQKAKNLQTAYDVRAFAGRCCHGDCQTLYFKLPFLLQKRQGMDIKQIKAFVSEELKGLKQEHRLLSLRESYCSSLWVWAPTSVSQHLKPFADISASETIMKTKTNQDFQELLRIEHCRNHLLFTLALVAGAALVSDFKFPCCSFTGRVWNPGMYYVHRGTHHQTGAFGLMAANIWQHPTISTTFQK